MLRSFLTITFRVLWRNKVTSLVNIFGLSMGIVSFVFIMLYVQHETSYDKFNKNYDRIYRLEADDFGKLPPMVGQYVKEKLPEVVNIARLSLGDDESYISYVPEINSENVKQIKASCFWADSTTFDVFTFPFIVGDPHTALDQPMTAVLTESTAQKLFGDSNPMMKTIEFLNHQFMVTGLIADVKKSHVEIDLLISLASIAKVFPERDLNRAGPNSWLWSATYLLMPDNVDKALVEHKINKALSEINDGSLIDIQFKNFHIRPLKHIYFDGNVQNLSYGLHGNLKMINILVAIGTFMIVLAGINYINLTTARSTVRAKEVAIKRVSGSSANQLRLQLIVESVIVSLISLVVAMTIMQLFLSKFNQLTTVNIQIDELNRPLIWLGIAGGGVLIGILAGMYPAFYLTAIRPVRLIKGGGMSGSGGSSLRSGLMTFQFALSIIMIIAIVVSFRQLNYTRTANLGFNKQIITVATPADIPDEGALRATFRESLKQHPGIEKVAFSAGSPGLKLADSPMLEINGIESSIQAILIDPEYLDVMGITLSQGRGFSRLSPGDQAKNHPVPNKRWGGVLLNESAVREFGIEDPVGKMIYTVNGRASFEIIGVVKDFHFRSFHEKIGPLAFAWFNESEHLANIKITSSNIPSTLKIIEAEWKNTYGQEPFEYQFLDETFNRQYKSDEHLATVIGYFTGLAIVIACLGLFALSSFMISRRTKEIGVRKTMGASVSTIYYMLSWHFLKWILLAIVLASPIGWYLMHLWLETFAYHVTLGVDVFVIAALLSIVIALVTVTWQSLAAANANPIKALRYE